MLIEASDMTQVWIYVNGHITDVVRTEDPLDEGDAQGSLPTLKLPSGQTHDKVHHVYLRLHKKVVFVSVRLSSSVINQVIAL